MRAGERFTRYEQRAQVLERIAKQYPEDSPELMTLKEAAYALCFAVTQRHEEFSRYLAEMNKPMTEKEEKRLKELGLQT